MINLQFSLTNPLWNRFKTIYSKANSTPFKHKFYEIQIMESDDIVTIDLRITTRRSHSGVDLWLGLFGYSINLNFYDNRHWNSEEGRWMIYTEEKGLH